MIGNSFVRLRPSIETLIVLKNWTREDVHKILATALCNESVHEVLDEDKHIIQVWADQAHERPMKSILGYLGENTDLSGGTIGEPNLPSKWTSDLQEIFENRMIANFRASWKYESGPLWSDDEIAIQRFTDYLWNVAVQQRNTDSS